MSPTHLLPPAVAQVLLGGQRADGVDPRLSHALDPQHHPAELLALRHHAVQLLESGPDLRLQTQTGNSGVEGRRSEVNRACLVVKGYSNPPFYYI